jgi:transcriptional regulator with XRE-family HTH domain
MSDTHECARFRPASSNSKSLVHEIDLLMTHDLGNAPWMGVDPAGHERRPSPERRGERPDERLVSRCRHDEDVAAIDRALAVADARADRLLRTIGHEIHVARVARGLSQSAIAAVAAVDQAEISRIERGKRAGVTIRTLARLAATVGLELSMKLYPAGQPLRDRAHVELFERLRGAVGPAWAWSGEVPLPIPGDKRAWDRVLRGAGIAIGMEGETRPMDIQELARRLALKKRDGGVDRLILVLSDTDWCRRIVRLNDLDAAFPVAGKVALRALAEGRDPGGDSIVLI